MRVLHIVPGLAARGGGVSASVIDLALGLQHIGVETTVFTTDLAGPAHASPSRPVRFDELPAGAAELDIRAFRSIPPRRLAVSIALGRAVRNDMHRFDVVHIHSLWLQPQFTAARAARRHGVPYIVAPHGMLDPYLRSRGRGRKALMSAIVQRRMLDGAAFIQFTTDDEARLAADVLPAVPRAIVPNPISWDAFQQPAEVSGFRREKLRGHTGPVVMSLGRISRKKGLDILVRAFAITARTHTDALLAIVGPDDDGLRPELELLARTLGMQDRVVFTGIAEREERLAALAAADIFALPSHTENFGVAVVEALASGLPTVISPAVNIAPDLLRARAGVVAETTPEAFAAELDALLANEGRRVDLGTRAREFARRYDRTSVATRFAVLYESCAAHRSYPVGLEAAHA
ncbi:MAG: glycosyltransferase [Gaiellaceae bacterium]